MFARIIFVTAFLLLVLCLVQQYCGRKIPTRPEEPTVLDIDGARKLAWYLHENAETVCMLGNGTWSYELEYNRELRAVSYFVDDLPTKLTIAIKEKEFWFFFDLHEEKGEKMQNYDTDAFNQFIAMINGLNAQTEEEKELLKKKYFPENEKQPNFNF